MKKMFIITFATFVGLALGSLNTVFAADCGCACAKTCNCHCEQKCDCHCCRKGNCNCGPDCKCHTVTTCGCDENCNCDCKNKPVYKKSGFFKRHMKCECEKKQAAPVQEETNVNEQVNTETK